MGIKSFALDEEKYSLCNVTFWGLCWEHGAKAFSSDPTISFGKRVVHFTIAAIETLPIISQIASIFEAVIILFACEITPSASTGTGPSLLQALTIDTALDASNVAAQVQQAALPILPLPLRSFIELTAPHQPPAGAASSVRPVATVAVAPRCFSIPKLANEELQNSDHRSGASQRHICGVNTAMQMIGSNSAFFAKFKETIRLWNENAGNDLFIKSDNVQSILRKIKGLILELEAHYQNDGTQEFSYHLDLNPIRELLHEFAKYYKKTAYSGSVSGPIREGIKAAPTEVLNDLIYGLRLGVSGKYPVSTDYDCYKFGIKGLRDWSSGIFIPESFQAGLTRAIQEKGLANMPDQLLVFRDNQESNTEAQPVPMTFVSDAHCAQDRRSYEYALQSFSYTTKRDRHYYAFIKREGHWFKCNDSEVVDVPENEIETILREGMIEAHEDSISRGTTMFRNFIYEREREVVTLVGAGGV